MGAPVLDDNNVAGSEQKQVSWAGRALALLVILNVFNYADRQILAAVVPSLRAEFFPPGAEHSAIGNWLGWLHGGGDSSNAALGSLAVAFMLFYMVGAPLFAMLPVRRWWLIGGSVIVWSLASGGSGLATTFGFLFLTRCLVGIGEAGYGPVAPAMIASLYPASVRGRKMAWFYLAVPFGAALGFGIAGVVTASLGWRWPFYLVTLPGIILGVLCFFMPEVDLPKPKKASASVYGTLLRTPSLRYAIAGGTLMTFAIGGICFWMSSYVSEFRKAGDVVYVNGMFGAILVIGGITGTMLGGYLSDWLQRLLCRIYKREHFAAAYLIVPTVGLLLATPFWVAMMLVPFPWAWLLALIACICLFSATSPINTVLATVVPAHMRTAAFALNIFVIHALGDVISPLVIGAVADATNMQVAFFSVSGTILLGSLLWLRGCWFVNQDAEAALKA